MNEQFFCCGTGSCTVLQTREIIRNKKMYLAKLLFDNMELPVMVSCRDVYQRLCFVAGKKVDVQLSLQYYLDGQANLNRSFKLWGFVNSSEEDCISDKLLHIKYNAKIAEKTGNLIKGLIPHYNFPAFAFFKYQNELTLGQIINGSGILKQGKELIEGVDQDCYYVDIDSIEPADILPEH